MYTLIDYEIADQIATIFLNRPEKKNAYTPNMGVEIVAALEAAMADSDVRVVILTGRGAAFCAGVDLDFMKAYMAGEDTGPGPTLGEEHLVNGWPLDVVAYPKPVIAALNGTAYGVGVTMTLGCDVRYAASGATLGLNFTTLGVLPGLGSTHHLPQLVGIGKALELILSGAPSGAGGLLAVRADLHLGQLHREGGRPAPCRRPRPDDRRPRHQPPRGRPGGRR